MSLFGPYLFIDGAPAGLFDVREHERGDVGRLGDGANFVDEDMRLLVMVNDVVCQPRIRCDSHLFMNEDVR